jgi:PIN domain nuclease of toxin-antitoxin system
MTYLDTHIAIELAAGDLRKIGPKGRRAIEHDNDLRISPMVLLEFEYMRLVKRVRLSATEIATALFADLGVRVCETSFAGVGRQALEEGWTTDPFDRLIVAQARWQKAKLITRDTALQDHYPQAFC